MVAVQGPVKAYPLFIHSFIIFTVVRISDMVFILPPNNLHQFPFVMCVVIQIVVFCVVTFCSLGSGYQHSVS
jgi:hypothetical protein